MNIILIPGFWLDASSRDHVVPLEQAGHRVRALTLPGLESECPTSTTGPPASSIAATPVGDGQAINDRMNAVEGGIPLPDWSEFGEDDLRDLDEHLRAAFRARAVPEPAAVASDPQALTDERRYDVPATIIACEYSSDQLKEWIAQVIHTSPSSR